MRVRLSNLTDAELGRLVRAGLLTVEVERAPGRRQDALDTRQEDDDRDAQLAEAHRRVRGAMVIPGFTVGHVHVPDLDLGAVDENTVASARVRAQYNAAMHRLGMRAVVGADTTYAALADFHVLLSRRAEQGDPQVEALMEHLGLTREQAEEVIH